MLTRHINHILAKGCTNAANDIVYFLVEPIQMAVRSQIVLLYNTIPSLWNLNIFCHTIMLFLHLATIIVNIKNHNINLPPDSNWFWVVYKLLNTFKNKEQYKKHKNNTKQRHSYGRENKQGKGRMETSIILTKGLGE